MAMKTGTRLGAYEITAPLGAGGMGEVYRASDIRLKRDVAIKVLPDVVAGDRGRLARFEQEARVLASLNHPHIASIYGLEESGGTPCLVLELVEGQTLSERLAKGGLPAEKVLDFGRQIASALEAAHEKGIIHRDLKPGNIKVTPDGTIKVLDFGLAKILEPEAPPVETTQAPTIPAPATREGAVVGTVPYMSPEQVRGERLDARTDIWAFGCVMYEMATGRLAFSGKTPAETGAAILEREPDWEALRARSTAGVERLVRRCLRKDARRRLHDIADARIEIEEPDDEAGILPERPGLSPWRTRLRWALGGLLGGVLIAILGGGLLGPASHAPAPTVRASLSMNGNPVPFVYQSPSLTVSPDGRTVVFLGGTPDGFGLYRRPLDGTAAEPIPGTERGYGPFFSPDGEWLAFFSGMDLLRVPITGGEPIRICTATPLARGGTWTPGGRIIFAPSFNGPLWAVGEGGGDPKPLTRLEQGEQAHMYPQILPGGRLLFTALTGRDFQDVASANAVVLDLDTNQRHVLLEGATFARYVGDGRIVFARGDSVFVVPLDLRTLRVTASPVALPETIMVDTDLRTPQLDVSREGALVYVSGSAAGRPTTEVLSLDPHGHETPLAVPRGHYGMPSLSPDGRRLALEDWEGFRYTVAVFDRDRKVLSSVVPEAGRFFSPVWSPDGRRLALSSLFHGTPRLVARAADGSGSIVPVTPPSEDGEVPNSWSPDGRTIAYTVIYLADRGGSRLRGTSDIWLVSSDGSSPPRPWMETPHRETSARFSPDGDLLAYVSDESGKNEVYVRPLDGQAKYQISSGGGVEPVWWGRGREILYRRGYRFFLVNLGSGPAIRPGPARLLLEHGYAVDGGRATSHHYWDVSAAGEEIIVERTTSPPEPDRALMVATGWLGGLEQTPSGR